MFDTLLHFKPPKPSFTVIQFIVLRTPKASARSGIVCISTSCLSSRVLSELTSNGLLKQNTHKNKDIVSDEMWVQPHQVQMTWKARPTQWYKISFQSSWINKVPFTWAGSGFLSKGSPAELRGEEKADDRSVSAPFMKSRHRRNPLCSMGKM